MFLFVILITNSVFAQPQLRDNENQDVQLIGTIISSVLHYDDFLEVNGYQRTTDTRKVKWVPCDGRSVAGSRYARTSNGSHVPDLRGVFLRGANMYEVPGYNPNPNNKQLNPENKRAGEFQEDAIVNHKHTMNLFKHGYAWGSANDGVSSNEDRGNNQLQKKSTDENVNGASETRPKNITVYFYLKIN